jgi:hypothetical protein
MKSCLLSLSAAARLPGAPTRAVLSGLANRKNPPAFIARQGGKPYIDTGHPAWARYLESREGGEIPPSLLEERAKGQQLKNEILMIDLERKKGNMIDVKIMRYFFSFIQRAFTDEVSATKAVMPELKRLLLAGADKQAQKLLLSTLQRVFNCTMDSLNREIDEELSGEAPV